MPKLRRPDGRIVSVSETGKPVLLKRGYTDVGAERVTYVPPPTEEVVGEKLDFPFAAGRIAPEGDLHEMSRRDLNVRAVAAGIESPERFPKKQAVIDAILKAEQDD